MSKDRDQSDPNIDEETFTQVVDRRQSVDWAELVLDDWYITASQPIWDSEFETIGILQVGTVEQRYLDIRDQIIIAFLTITLIGALIAIVFAYFISQRISVPLNNLSIGFKEYCRG